MQAVLWALGLFVTAYPLLFVGVGVLYVYKKRRIYVHQRLLAQSDVHADNVTTIGVFHPYANGGGGGERVLYCLLIALVEHFERKNKALRVLLYTGDDGLTAMELLTRAAERFNLPQLLELNVEASLRVITLKNRAILEGSRYPRFTLFWQSVAHIRLALDAFRASEKAGFYPQIFVDTTGCPFAYGIASGLYACKVVAYVHYPMISTDMITKVQQRAADFNNDNAIATSSTRSTAKYIYYRLFAGAYGLVGRTCTDVVMVNSTWTYNHIKALWGGEPTIVYPPCGNLHLEQDDGTRRAPIALSISQFRPEKNQLLQLQALKVLLTKYRTEMATLCPDFKLVLLGSCRNADDERRVALLQEQSADLGVSSSVEFVVNASFADLKALLSRASIGLHTMYNEHFGISIVEMMAAGLAVVANNSGGPAADIVKPGTGFLALTADEYAAKMLEILQTSDADLTALRERARTASHRFSDHEFGQQCLAVLASTL